jgi:shikimate dehydrogenase
MSIQPVSGQSRVVGIFGDPITHTRSPAMQNVAFRARNLPYVYVPFHVRSEDLPKATQGIRALDLAGVNVTVPHKERIIRYLDELSDEARLCGAVNTVVNRQGTLFGDNTDGRGFLVSLQERGFSPRKQKIVLIGAGGAARALVVSLIQAGTGQILIVNRTFNKAQTLARSYRSLSKTQIEALPLDTLQDPRLLQEATLVINCTSVGLHGEEFPALAYTAASRGCLFYDLLYGSHPTSFMQQARAAHRATLDGRRMLLHQGALAFSLWTGMAAPLAAMARALNRSLRHQS